jgi:hypothetical protein
VGVVQEWWATISFFFEVTSEKPWQQSNDAADAE